jgi:phospholipid/cholesterol/gamma-HCH transport system ATP-binding protein
MIRIEDLHKSFDGVEVLKGASLEVQDGQVVALIGPSGEGKSVLLKHVAGLMQPDAGRILYDGKDIGGLGRRELAEFRSHLGFLFQSGSLFDSMTVYDNVAFPLREKTRLSEEEIGQRVFDALLQVGLAGAEQKVPAQLSGGMAKRAAIARAMVLSPEIMLFDEPTTGLDPVIVRSIHDLIVATHDRLGFSGILVSHEIPGVFAIVQKVAFLHEGVIRFVGTPQEILATEDSVVRSFIRGSMPPQEFMLPEQEPTASTRTEIIGVSYEGKVQSRADRGHLHDRRHPLPERPLH